VVAEETGVNYFYVSESFRGFVRDGILEIQLKTTNQTGRVATTYKIMALPAAMPEKTEVIDGGMTDLTPIEVVLGVDGNGMTTAKKLYRFLELYSSNYAGWVQMNIVDNIFAEEGKDYISFFIHEERFNPNPTQGYKLTATFAKKLCMTSNSPRGDKLETTSSKSKKLPRKCRIAVARSTLRQT